jgi:hypothetical protein
VGIVHEFCNVACNVSIIHLNFHQVSSIYADASIGNSIKIAVVHIMHIEHDLVPMETSSGNGMLILS